MEFSLNEVIELAIQIEKSGYQFYDTVLQRKDLSNKAKELIERLRNEEINHERIFKSLRTDNESDTMGDQVEWQAAASYLKAISDSHVFSKPDAAIKLAIEAANEIDIIDSAIHFEKDTLIFFHALHQNTSDTTTQKIIKKIIDEEVSHVVLLAKIKREL
ncbi:MAG: ferritin family protein [FCB group bacterium]|nr:ferritin family protein [FCB group bacterium]